MKRLKEYLLIN